MLVFAAILWYDALITFPFHIVPQFEPEKPTNLRSSSSAGARVEAVWSLVGKLEKKERAHQTTSQEIQKPPDPIEANHLAETARSILESLAKPTSWEDHLRAHRLIRVIHSLDPAVYAKVAASIPQRVNVALNALDRSIRNVQTGPILLDQSEPLVRQIYRLINLLVSAEGLAICTGKLAEVEREISMRGPKAIVAFLNGQIDASKAHDAERQEELQKAARVALKLGQASDASGSMKTGFRGTGSHYIYDFSAKDPKAAHWRLEPYSDDHLCLRCVENQDMIASMSLKEFFEAIEKSQIDEILRQAVRNYQSEQDGAEALDAFDLPKNGKTVYLRLFPKALDRNMAANLHGALLLSRALQHRYGEQLESRPIIFSDQPKQALIRQIENAYQDGKGSKSFVIDVFSHGVQDHLCFTEELTAKDLADVVRSFPDCTFIFGTIACHGGGLRQGFLDEFSKSADKNPSQRTSVFLQTKPNSVGFNAMRPSEDGRPNMGATHYLLHFMRALYDGKTYGEAARIADTETKKYLPQDSEAIINGKLISFRQSNPGTPISVGT